MPKSNGRPQNRKAKQWIIKMNEYPFLKITTFPFEKTNDQGSQHQIKNVTITNIK